MKKSKVAVIYPISKEFVEILKYKEMLVDYERLIPVSIKGQGIDNRDAGELVKDNPYGVRIVSDFNKSIKEATEIIFTEFSDLVYEKIMYSIEQGKNIVCLFNIEDEVEKKIMQKCKDKNLYYKNYCRQNNDCIKMNEDKLKQINVPIVIVCGLSEYTNKFELQVKVRSELLKRGYRVSQIGSKKYSSLFGIHNFPEFMYSNIQDIKKINLFNTFVKQIENEEKPDIFVIGVPGGVMPYDAEHPNGFGIINYLVSSAINVDYALLSVAYNDYQKDFWDFAENYMRYKYEYTVKSFHFSNIFHDIYGDERNGKERLIYANMKKVDEKIKSLAQKDVFNLNNGNVFSSKIDEIINYLSN